MSRVRGNASRFRLPKGRAPALRELLQELHSLHARADYPSARWISLNYDVSYGATLKLFKNEPKNEPPRPGVLLPVVRFLANEAKLNEDDVCDKFDKLWQEAVAEAQELRS